jgi:hypothetical protein
MEPAAREAVVRPEFVAMLGFLALLANSATAADITAAQMNKAAKCNFGHYRFGSNTDEVPVSMTTSADGWCWTTPRSGGGAGFNGQVSEKPAHGQVAIVDDDGRNRFAYKPDAGYVGPDHFRLQLYSTGRVHPTLVVTVDVQK